MLARLTLCLTAENTLGYIYAGHSIANYCLADFHRAIKLTPKLKSAKKQGVHSHE